MNMLRAFPALTLVLALRMKVKTFHLLETHLCYLLAMKLSQIVIETQRFDVRENKGTADDGKNLHQKRLKSLSVYYSPLGEIVAER